MEPSTLVSEHEDPALLTRAGQGRRFANLLIDTVAIIALAAMLGAGAALLGLDGFLAAADDPLLSRVIGILLTIGYYLLLEGLLGRTFGKMVTGTRVVCEDGSMPDFATIFKRTMWRVVPFEAFSFLGDGYGWHDSRSETLVVRG